VKNQKNTNFKKKNKTKCLDYDVADFQQPKEKTTESFSIGQFLPVTLRQSASLQCLPFQSVLRFGIWKYLLNVVMFQSDKNNKKR
jgi:hypothetical protein